LLLFFSCGVRGRVISKSGVRLYGTSDGRMFSFGLMDDSGSVRVKAFNENCDRILAAIVVGRVRVVLLEESVLVLCVLYFQMIELSAFGVCVSNKAYGSFSGDYEIIILSEAVVSIVQSEPIVDIYPSFRFRSVRELETLNVDALYGLLLTCSMFH
jgi:hypothetical protein